MLIQALVQSDPEKVFIVGQNVSSATLLGNTLVCFDGVLPAAASFGNAFNNPVTSNLGLFAGVLNADVASNAYGLIQAYGMRASIAANPATNVSISAAGLILGPGAGLVSAQSNGRSFALGPIVLFDNDISGTGYYRGFIRAL